MGNSFIEAMAAGLPVIATQEGGIADFLFDEKKNPDKASTGFAVDKDTPSHIADVVQRILNNPEATQKTIATAKVMVQKSYTWDSVTVGVRQLFAKIFEKSRVRVVNEED
jgi:glycosyltransferase involved in cell wall biosynthesis